jgi:hypothetical protein
LESLIWIMQLLAALNCYIPCHSNPFMKIIAPINRSASSKTTALRMLKYSNACNIMVTKSVYM